jgi:2-oxoglutarate ferredoxin oxidoreductase subunit delta
MAKVTFKNEECKGCELCVEACPKKIVMMRTDIINNKGYHPAGIIEIESCTGCGFCAMICPDCVIDVEK